MVSADGTDGDGVNRPFKYASFRTDKKAREGYSAELICDRVGEEHYDEDFDKQPHMLYGGRTLFALFKQTVQERGDQPFLGTRYKRPM